MRKAACLLCLSLMLTACGGRDGEQEAGAETLRRANIAEPSTLDPQLSEGVSSGNVLRDLFEGLVGEARDGSLVPGAAEAWQIDDAGTTYRFTLRADARWSDGSPVTAGDFVAGLRRAVDPETNSTYGSLLAPIVNAEVILRGEAPVTALGVSAPDPRTVEIRLRQPTPYFLGLLASPISFPVHRENLARHGADFVRPEHMISNGAYQIVDWRVGDRLTAVRNPHYWGAEDVAIERVEFLPIETETSELNMFQAGELDFTNSVPNSQFAALRQRYPEALRVAPLLGTYFLVFDTTQPPLDDARLREALSIAIDRDDFVNVVLGVGQTGAWGMVPPGINGYDNFSYAWRGWPRERQLERARELYREAGYSADNPLKLRLLYNTGDNHRRNVVAVQGMWRQNLGVETELVNEEWKVMLQTRFDFDAWDVLRFGWNGDYNDANTFLEIFRSDSALNASGWKSTRFDTLLDAANAELDAAERAQMLLETERFLMQNYPVLPLYFYASKHLVGAHVEGFNATIMDRIYSKHLSFAERND